MRRQDRAIVDPREIQTILEQAKVMRIALNNGAYPYLLPVNFGFVMEGDALTLIFHGAKDGAKHEIIQKDNHVSFEVDCTHRLIPPKGAEPCTASFAYASVIGQGVIEKVDDADKAHLLNLLLAHYGIPSADFSSARLANTVVYRIIVHHYTAKRRAADD